MIAFYSPGGLQRILDGKMGFWTVTPSLLLGVAVLMSAPAVMVALTVLLKPVASRWLNVFMGSAETALTERRTLHPFSRNYQKNRCRSFHPSVSVKRVVARLAQGIRLFAPRVLLASIA
jgi:hypothetical protein